MQNRMFSRMLDAACERLQHRDPLDVACRAGIEYDAHAKLFRLQSLGEDVQISWPSCEVQPKPAGWHELLILHYLDLADGTPVCGKMISLSQMKDGMVRGGGFDRRFEQSVQGLMKEISPCELEQKCAAMGGRILNGNADFAVELPFLPRLPVQLKIWFADEDFDASGRMQLDASADHYLTIEDAVTVGEILLERLSN